jgi:hypothetical protein
MQQLNTQHIFTHFTQNTIKAFKYCAQEIFSLLEKTPPPGLQNLSSIIFSLFYIINTQIKNWILIAVLRNLEQFQICSVFFLYTL